jgi:hypothetical protein
MRLSIWRIPQMAAGWQRDSGEGMAYQSLILIVIEKTASAKLVEMMNMAIRLTACSLVQQVTALA